MPTTTNYGWTTPADTDLVKDGAAAIRTLGSSIDTSVKSLNAGTTAGDIDYYTSSTAKARVGIGTTGQVLTVAGGVPSWATSSSGGMTLISTTTLTGASVTLSSIPQTYNKLYIIIQNYQPTTDAQSLRMRMNADSTANRHYSINTFAVRQNDSFNNTFIEVAPTADNATTTSLIEIEIPNYTNTSTWKMLKTQSLTPNETTPTTFNATFNQGYYNQTGAISSLSFLTSSVNLTAGTVLLYGVK
jgi:hypothetical protein